MAEPEKMDIEAIMRQLPHRYPMLLVDRVLECVPGKHIHALKNVTLGDRGRASQSGRDRFRQ